MLRRCGECGREFPEGEAPEGLCPYCLLQGATASVKWTLHSTAFAPDLVTGDRLGHYRIVRLLGQGGMGMVYLANQEEGVQRQVAIKIIKLGMDTREVVARFESERQALAVMDHPNIAQVFEVGSTNEGRPYFVMEYVPGVEITQYCDDNRLNVHQRLRLFLLVCGAVQHAHQKGIIHRDIKPSNILVRLQDGAAVPKIIDFGLVKNHRLKAVDLCFD